MNNAHIKNLFSGITCIYCMYMCIYTVHVHWTLWLCVVSVVLMSWEVNDMTHARLESCVLKSC